MVGLAAQEAADTDLRYLSFLSLGLAVEVLFEPLKNGGQLPFFKPQNAVGVSNRYKTPTP
jgi:hypothetical protein